MSSAVTPILATGGIVLVAGWRREQGWPKNGVKSVAAIVVLLIVASALGSTKAGPVVAGISWLIFLGAVYASAPIFTPSIVKSNQKG